MSYEILAIAAPVGGFGPIRRLLAELREDFPVPVLCLQSSTAIDPARPALTTLPGLRFCHAEIGVRPEPGCAYLTPPGSTIIVTDARTLTLAPFATESGSLNACDAFLYSIAAAYGKNALVVAIACTGEDGLSGLRAVRAAGGTVLGLITDGPYPNAAVEMVKEGIAAEALAADMLGFAVKLRVLGPRLTTSDRVRRALAPILEETLRSQRTHLGKIAVHDLYSGALRLLVQRGFPEDVLREIGTISTGAESACARALRLGHRVMISDVRADDGYVEFRAVAERAGYRAVQSTPIFLPGDGIIGMLSTNYAEPQSLEAERLQRLDEFALAAGDVITRFL